MASKRTQTILCVVILVFWSLGCVRGDDIHPQLVKKDLGKEIDITPLPQMEQKPNADKNNDVPEKKVEDTSSDIEQKNTNEQKVEPQQQTASTNSPSTHAGNKTLTQPISSPPSSSSPPVFYHQEEIILGSNEEISDSLKTGFYFFAALSLSAIIFIVFKVYRLRLSRAERKYGVQGDRSTQELTPLPLIEDGHSDDDEDHTLFEVQRQNIRIL